MSYDHQKDLYHLNIQSYGMQDYILQILLSALSFHLESIHFLCLQASRLKMDLIFCANKDHLDHLCCIKFYQQEYPYSCVLLKFLNPFSQNTSKTFHSSEDFYLILWQFFALFPSLLYKQDPLLIHLLIILRFLISFLQNQIYNLLVHR